MDQLLPLSFRLSTRRLNIRPLVAARDGAAVAEFHAGLGFIPAEHSYYCDPLAYHATLRRAWGETDFLCFRRGTKLVVATLGVRLDRDRQLRVSYQTHPNHRRQGFAAEAQGAMIAALARQYPKRGFAADIDLGNTASKRVLIGSGFTIRGLRQSRIPDIPPVRGLAFSRPSLRAARP